MLTNASGEGVWNGLGNLFGEVKDLAIDYTRAKYINAETARDDRNVPDQADLRNGYGYAAASDATGGIFQAAPGGVTMQQWLLIGAAAVVGVIVLKRVL
jgi:hypothetical protein